MQVEDVRTSVGREVGVSNWLAVTQDLIDGFAALTGDRQWIHVDTDRARSESPFGATVAHGFLTVALMSRLVAEATDVRTECKLRVNYGFNRAPFSRSGSGGSQDSSARYAQRGARCRRRNRDRMGRDGGDREPGETRRRGRVAGPHLLLRRPMSSHETIAMREGERIAAGALAEYLRGRIEGAGNGMELEQFPNGHSNLTYLLRIGGREYVLRRPPLGPVAPKAHDMVREYHVLRAVHPHYPQAPQVFLLCEDPGGAGRAVFCHGAAARRGLARRRSRPRWPPSRRTRG